MRSNALMFTGVEAVLIGASKARGLAWTEYDDAVHRISPGE